MLGAALSLIFAASAPSPVKEELQRLTAQAIASRASTRSEAPLLQMWDSIDQVDDLNLLAEPYSRIVASKTTHPQVRTLARLLLAEVEAARGRTSKIAEILAPLGFVQDWSVVGGFGNEVKSGCDTDFGPETARDTRGTFAVGTRKVGWRSPMGRSLNGYVDLSATLRPNQEAVGYATTVLLAPQSMDATLGFGVSGGYRLWINGSRVGGSDRYNNPQVDQYRYRVRLRKGANAVLLKVCQGRGKFGFYFRAVGPRGPIKASIPETIEPSAQGLVAKTTELPNWSAPWEAGGRKRPNDAQLKMDMARVMAFASDWSEEERAPQRLAASAAELAPSDAALLRRAAHLHGDEPNVRRKYLQDAIAAKPNDPWARSDLAELEEQSNHPERALLLSSEIIADVPEFAAAWATKVRALDALGEDVASDRLAEEAFRRFPYMPAIAKLAAISSHRAGRRNEEVERLRLVIALRSNDLQARRDLAERLAALGNHEAADEQFRHILALAPFDFGAALRMGELALANGMAELGGAAFATAQRLAPDDPTVWEAQGRALLWDRASEADAKADFDRALVLSPQNPNLREILDTLESKGVGPTLGTPIPMATFLKEVPASLAAAGSNADAVILADNTRVRLQANGLTSRYRQLVVKVLNAQGIDRWRSVPVTWSPDRQRLRVLLARHLDASGVVLGSATERDQRINEPWTGMFYDARARVISFSGLVPGNVIELQWELDDTASENLLADSWGDLVVLQAAGPVHDFRYEVEVAGSRPLYWNQQSLPPWLRAKRTATRSGTTYLFAARDIPSINPEPQMPGWSEVSAYLHLSTFKSWQDVGSFYQDLVKDQLVPNEDLKREVARVLQGVETSDTKKVVAAIYDYVVTNTRYVALEFGIHGYKPYRVDQVFARGFGDCKDKASLLITMLKIAGVDAQIVLLRTRDLGLIKGEVASLAAFNHAIAYVPSLDRYLDGTAAHHGSNELPSADQGAAILLVKPNGQSRFLVTPEAPAEANRLRFSLAATIANDGSSIAEGQIVAIGHGAPSLRDAYQSEGSRLVDFERQLGETYPAARVISVEMSDPKALEVPVTLAFKAKIPRFAEAGNGYLKFSPLGSPRIFTQTLAPLATRQLDVQFPEAWENRFEMRYRLPEGASMADLPSAVRLESPFGWMEFAAERKDASVLVHASVTLSARRVKATEYAKFRSFVMEMDQIFGRKLRAQLPATSALPAARGTGPSYPVDVNGTHPHQPTN